MSPDRLRNQIDAAIAEPRAWLAEADKLKRAADFLGNQFQREANAWLQFASLDLPVEDAAARDEAFSLAPAYLMLAGYALEDLAKGLILVNDPSDKSLEWVTTHHLSLKMVERARIALDGGEPDLVDRLGHRIRWAGRYPAPSERDARSFADSVDKLGPFWGSPMRASTDDVRQVDELFCRMREQLVDLV